MRFDTKIAVLLRDDLLTWQRLNITAFLAGGVAAAVPEVIGEPYEDAGGVRYLPMFRQPVLVFEGGQGAAALGARPGDRPRPGGLGVHLGPLRHRQRPGQPGGRARGRHREPGPGSAWPCTARATRWTRS
nr:hypothetical protein GCM10020092_069440 [Actinoplanes digitatis]